MPVTLPATGESVATETIGSDEYQWVKIGHGASGAFALTSDAKPYPTYSASDLKPWTPTIDASIYADGDVFFETTELTNMVSAAGLCCQPIGIKIINKSPTVIPEMTLYFFDRTVTFGTRNGVPSLSDTDAAFFLGAIDIWLNDWYVLPNNSFVAKPVSLDVWKPNATSIFVAGRIKGTPTPASTSEMTFVLAYLKA